MAAFAALAAVPYYIRERRDNQQNPNRVSLISLVQTAIRQVVPYTTEVAKGLGNIKFSGKPKLSATTLFFAGTGLFFLSGNLFYTPYTPYLKANGVTDAQVFIAYTALSVSKVIYLPFNNRLVAAGGGEQRMAKLAYAPRIGGTILAVTAAVFAVGNPNIIFYVTLAAFISVDLAFSLWNTTTTSSFMKVVPKGGEGKMFGVSQAVTGFGLLLGSIAGGEISASFGYATSFCTAIVALGLSLWLLRASFARRKVSAESKLEVKTLH
jgi:predicted MFS family arabinose efflux permease